MNLRDIAREWLEAHGYDGLAYRCGCDGCGCGLDDLIPCDGACFDDCKPVRRVTWDTCQWREHGCPEGYTRDTCIGCYSLQKPEAGDGHLS